ncbi:unnamed protein product [Effrenium voratum]|uniref:Uncharacterized protein n=1 Tax=Effrenium voratum TaxID=2562239 RepID=A0AA36JB03_9DINO|nr:unnamed protein product [Effrenium voratum]
MDSASTKKVLDKFQVAGMASFKKVANKELRPMSALRCKLCFTLLLYLISFYVISDLDWAFTESWELPVLEVNNITSSTLLLELKDCNMDLQWREGSSITVRETTLVPDGDHQLHVSWNETSDVLRVICSGPSLEGDAVTVQVQVGSAIHFNLVELTFEPGGRSLFRSAPYVNLGDNFTVSGDDGILQIYPSRIGRMSVQLDSGFIFLYEVDFDEASFVLGNEVDVYLWQDTYHRSVNVHLQTGDGLNASSGLCLSDAGGMPSLSASDWGEYDYGFSLGSSWWPRILNISRGNANSRLFLTHGVWRSHRNCGNTLDSVAKMEARLDASFSTWSTEVAESGSELMNLWLLGASLGTEIQSMSSRGFWIFSQFGDALTWFPVSLWNIFTLGIFSPRTARGVFLVKDSLCLPKRDRITVGKSNCRPMNSTEESLHTQVVERCTKAWRNSLPDALNLTNTRNGRIYYVLHHFHEGNTWLPALAHGAITIMSASTSAFVKLVHGPEHLRGAGGLVFVTVMILLAVGGGAFACLLVASLYRMQRKRYMKARGTDKKNKAIRDMQEMEARSNLLMTLVRCLVLRSPSGKASVTPLKAAQLCLGHFVVMQLLITPLVLVAILNVSNIPELRTMCNFNEWMEGTCIYIRHAFVSSGILSAAFVMNSIFFLNTVLEYVTRHGIDVAEETGTCPKIYKVAMMLRASCAYRAFLTAGFLASLFFFCAYFILVIIFVLLGTLLKPERLAPILVAIGGAVVVAQQMTQKFNEFVEKAKVMAAEWLAKNINHALELGKEALGEHVEGMAGSIMDASPFAKEALARVGVSADSFSAEKIEGMAGSLINSVAEGTLAQVSNADSFDMETMMSNMRHAAANSAASAVAQAKGAAGSVVTSAAQEALAQAHLGEHVEGMAGSIVDSAPFAKEALARVGVNADSFSAEKIEGMAGSLIDSVAEGTLAQVSNADSFDMETMMSNMRHAAENSAASAVAQAKGAAGSVVTSAAQEALAQAHLGEHVEGMAGSIVDSAPFAKEALARVGVSADSFSAEKIEGMAGSLIDSVAEGTLAQVSNADSFDMETMMGNMRHAAENSAASAVAQAKGAAGSVMTSTLQEALAKAGVSADALNAELVMDQVRRAAAVGGDASSDALLQRVAGCLPGIVDEDALRLGPLKNGADPMAMAKGVLVTGMKEAPGVADGLTCAASISNGLVEGAQDAVIDVNTLSPIAETSDGEKPRGLLRSLTAAVGNVVQDVEAAVGDVVGDEDEPMDLENVLVMLGLSKGQLLLLNINAVLLFLCFVGFCLVGSMLFLGPGMDALIPQLTSTVATLTGAVGMIRSKGQEIKNADFSAMSGALKDAAHQLEHPDVQAKKEQ